MATNIEEAIQEAINELLAKSWVKTAIWDQQFTEEKPGNYVRKRINVLHKTSDDGGYTYSAKELYINKSDFTYIWHYGGPNLEPVSTPFRDLIVSKFDNVKTAMNLDYIELVSVDETVPSAIVLAVKATTGNLAETYTLKIWKTGADTLGYKIISKTMVT